MLPGLVRFEAKADLQVLPHGFVGAGFLPVCDAVFSAECEILTKVGACATCYFDGQWVVTGRPDPEKHLAQGGHVRADRRFFESCSQGRVGSFGDSLFKHQTALSGQCRVNAVVSGVADPAMLYSLVCCCRVDSVNIAPDARAGSSVMQPQEFVHEGVAVGAGVPEQSGGEVIHQVVEAGMGSVEDGLGKHACHAVRRKIAQVRRQGEHVGNRHVVHGEIGVVVPEMDTPGDTTPACQITTKRNAGRVVGRGDRIGDAAVVAGQLDVYVVAGAQRPGRPLGIGISQCANQYVRVFFRDANGQQNEDSAG